MSALATTRRAEQIREATGCSWERACQRAEREQDHLPTPALQCLEGPDGCAGPVEYRWPGYGERSWPRCQRHGDARVAREKASIERNGNPDSPCPPAWFDPMDAGERWDEDD